jgi:hypothetical protein
LKKKNYFKNALLSFISFHFNLSLIIAASYQRLTFSMNCLKGFLTLKAELQITMQQNQLIANGHWSNILKNLKHSKVLKNYYWMEWNNYHN